MSTASAATADADGARDQLTAESADARLLLLLTRQTVTALPTLTCKNAPALYVVDLERLVAWQQRCRRNTCPHCVRLNARRRALAITVSGPERMIRLSLVADADDPDPLATARIRIKRMRQALVRKGIRPGEWSWTIERNPKGTGYHAHAVQRGSYIPQEELQDACERAGAGIPYINLIRGNPSRTARYGLKTFGAAGYGLKTFGADDDGEHALAVNHGRLEHHSPGFFHIAGQKARVREVETYGIAQLTDYRPPLTVVTTPAEAWKLLHGCSPETLQILTRIAGDRMRQRELSVAVS